MATKKKTRRAPEAVRRFYEATLDAVNALTDDKTKLALVEPFAKLPSKKLYPDYYEVIAEPICIADIQRKVQKGRYPDGAVDEFVADFKLLLDNAAKYNDPSSWIVADATRIHQFVAAAAAALDDDVTAATLPQRCEDLLRDVMAHEFPDLGAIAGPFLDVVDRRDYPDYYKMIKTPTSFNKVLADIAAKKLFSPKDSLADNLDRFHAATVLIFANAQTYNDPSSLIHQDSVVLQQYFQARFDELRARVQEPLKLKVKPPRKEKLTLKLKASDDGRKKRRVEVKPEPEDEPDDEPEEEDDDDDEDDDDKDVRPVTSTLESNVMGKTDTLGSTKDVFITYASVHSPLTAVSHLAGNVLDSGSKAPVPTRAQQLRHALFPSHGAETITSLFEYKFPSNGYCSQSYTVSLPSDAAPYVSFKFLLHDILQKVKHQELMTGSGYSKSQSDEAFTCRLFINDDEVTKSSDDEMTYQYDLKLSYGLNIVTFECKVAPNVSKLIKKTTQKAPESEDAGGRHTRHQLQQLKRSWEMERYTFFIVCND